MSYTESTESDLEIIAARRRENHRREQKALSLIELRTIEQKIVDTLQSWITELALEITPSSALTKREYFDSEINITLALKGKFLLGIRLAEPGGCRYQIFDGDNQLIIERRLDWKMDRNLLEKLTSQIFPTIDKLQQS